MKKRIFIGIAAIAVVAGAAVNVALNQQPTNKMSNISLANVEALAGEVSVVGCCPGGGICIVIIGGIVVDIRYGESPCSAN